VSLRSRGLRSFATIFYLRFFYLNVSSYIALAPNGNFPGEDEMRFHPLSVPSLTALSLIAAALFTMIAFTVSPVPVRAAIICADPYKPVCAVRHGKRRTFPNACDARRVHARILHHSACAAPKDVCVDQFAPVCAVNPVTHRHQTYGNACQAEVAEATVVHEGACP
jgi:hypothetical protein